MDNNENPKPNKPKKNITLIISVLCLILCGLTYLKTLSLADQIYSMQTRLNALNDNLNSVSGNIGSISTDVRNSLNESASILAKTDYDMGKINTENNTVEVNFNITPKEYKEGSTAKIYINNVPYDMTYSNGNFVYTYTGSVEKDITPNKIEILSNGVSYFESLENLSINAKETFFPYIYADFNYSKSDVANGKLTLDGDINANYAKYSDTDYEIVSAKAIALVNDKTVKEYTGELENNGDVYSYIHISDTFDIGNSGKFRLILVTTDSRGYIYENTLFGLSTNTSGTILNDGNSNEYYLTRVYDKDHNFLFDKEY